jgi:hypothetical protein
MGELLVYVLIILSLSLAGLTAMQFFYMILLERRDREQKKRVRDLEQRCLYLADRINAAGRRTPKTVVAPESGDDSNQIEDDLWADVLEDR